MLKGSGQEPEGPTIMIKMLKRPGQEPNGLTIMIKDKV